jgi:peptidoglycan L-alanyl-D-glutamate endopeptidase CwlK
VTSLSEASARTLRAIDTLDAGFQKRVRGWLNEMVASRITPLIYCGRRTMEEQAALFAKGRTSGGRIVTKAKPGQSYHNYGLAFDWVPIKPAPKNADLLAPDWDDETAFRLGEHVGLTFELAAISWETGHLQAAEYNSWRDIPRDGVEQKTEPVVVKGFAVKKRNLVSGRPWSSR